MQQSYTHKLNAQATTADSYNKEGGRSEVESRQRQTFLLLAMGPTQPHSQWVAGFLPRGKAAGT
jgi:hypothetical protein